MVTHDVLPPHQPFRVAEALAAGLTRRQLESRDFAQVMRGVFVRSSQPFTPVVRAQAALALSPPGSVVAKHIAALLWGGIVPHTDVVHVRVPPGCRARTRGIQEIRGSARADVDRTHSRQGVPVTSPEQTFLDCAPELALVDLVVLADSLVRRGVTSTEALAAAAAATRGRAAVRARRAARLARSGVDSPQESRLRLLLVMAGMPEPRVNVILRDVHGEWVIRFDLAYEEWRIAVEYDGRQHAETSRQWHRDLARREELDNVGWRLIVVTAEHLWNDPAGVLRRVEAVLRGAGVRWRPRDEWRQHFPQRA